MSYQFGKCILAATMVLCGCASDQNSTSLSTAGTTTHSAKAEFNACILEEAAAFRLAGGTVLRSSNLADITCLHKYNDLVTALAGTPLSREIIQTNAETTRRRALRRTAAFIADLASPIEPASQ